MTPSITQTTLHLNPQDNVVIAREALPAGTHLVWPDGTSVVLPDPIPTGHKLALTDLEPGQPVLRYGQEIGTAHEPIPKGAHVHTHNLRSGRPDKVYTFSQDLQPVEILPVEQQRTFLGYPRPDGRVGTRNYIAVIATAQCAAQVCHRIAAAFTPERLAPFTNVDGVIALTPEGGCGGQPDYDILQRTLAGMADHPNVGATILVGLGCEGNQLADMLDHTQLIPLQVINDRDALVIQELGGSAPTIQAGIRRVEAYLPKVNAAQRSPQPLSRLSLALECGGSDSWSGITANPLVGLLSDEIVRQGGTVVLAETPEIFGAEHLLTRRAITPEVGRQLLARLDWWRDYTARLGSRFEDNPSPGNQAGGLTNICEKSLGAIAKSGSTPLMAVYEYAQHLHQPGFVFMDTTGYDPVSVTGMVAGGCNLVLFTTGRGSVFGFKPAPSIKVSTNSATYQRMQGDMDFDAGLMLSGETSPAQLASELLDLVVVVASGQPPKSETLGLGELEFSPWTPLGPV